MILGRAGFSAANLNVQVIDGDPAYTTGAFGVAVLGMGRLYVNTSGSTLVVAANNAGVNGRGRVYAFHGIAGSSTTLTAVNADNFIEGPIDSGNYGSALGLMGPIAPAFRSWR